MSHQDWIALFAPAVATLTLALAGFVGAVLTGLTTKAKTWLSSHGEANVASAVASANTVIQAALQTGAATIAGKISRGEIDYTNRAAIEAEAKREVALAQQRVPDMMAIAQPAANDLIASLMGKVDGMVVASPTLPSTPVVNAPAPAIIPANKP